VRVVGGRSLIHLDVAFPVFFDCDHRHLRSLLPSDANALRRPTDDTKSAVFVAQSRFVLAMDQATRLQRLGMDVAFGIGDTPLTGVRELILHFGGPHGYFSAVDREPSLVELFPNVTALHLLLDYNADMDCTDGDLSCIRFALLRSLHVHYEPYTGRRSLGVPAHPPTVGDNVVEFLLKFLQRAKDNHTYLPHLQRVELSLGVPLLPSALTEALNTFCLECPNIKVQVHACAAIPIAAPDLDPDLDAELDPELDAAELDEPELVAEGM
jgi:hypothetical protein